MPPTADVADVDVSSALGSTPANAGPPTPYAPAPETTPSTVAANTLPVPPPATQPSAPPAHRSFMANILGAVADVLGGSTKPVVNPSTGAIEQKPMTGGEKAKAGIGGALEVLGTAASGWNKNPTNYVAQQQERNQRQLQEQSENVRQTNAAAQQKLLQDATLAKMSQDQARGALDLKVKGMELDENQTKLAGAMQDILNIPGAKVLQHFDSNSEINAHLEQVGPELAKQYAIDLAKNNIRLVQNPKGGFDAVEVPKGQGETAIGEGHKLYTYTPKYDPKTQTVQNALTETPADPSMTWDKYQTWNGTTMAGYNGALQAQQKLEDEKATLEKTKAETAKEYAETNLANVQAHAIISSQQADPFGSTSTLPQKELLKRQDSFQKDVVNKAYDVEKSYNMANDAFTQYISAQKQGKALPSGAQSMLLLSQHLSTTFGGVKGSRITKDMILEHLHARSVTDDAQVAVQRLVNGDQLSSNQWSAFHELISQSRNETWANAISNAKNQQLPITFLPRGNGQKLIDPATAKIYLEAAQGDAQKARTAAQKQGWITQVQ